MGVGWVKRGLGWGRYREYFWKINYRHLELSVSSMNPHETVPWWQIRHWLLGNLYTQGRTWTTTKYNQGEFRIKVIRPVLPLPAFPHHPPLYQWSLAQLQLIELPITFPRIFTRHRNWQQLILTVLISRRLGGGRNKDEDGVNPRCLGLGARGHISSDNRGLCSHWKDLSSWGRL